MKKYLYKVAVKVTQTFTVLAESEAAARAIAMDDNAWHHLEDIGTEGDIDAVVVGWAQLDWRHQKLGVYVEDGAHRCIFCHTPIQYGTGNDYTCECEEAPNEQP